MSTATEAPITLTAGMVVTVPSGMGGTFDVKLTALRPEEGSWDGRIYAPRNPDWHNVPWIVWPNEVKWITSEEG